MTEPTYIIIDAIEGALARVELPDGRFTDVPRAWLPSGVREGDHVRVQTNGDGHVAFAIDRDATDAARDAAQAAIDAITDEPPEGFRI